MHTISSLISHIPPGGEREVLHQVASLLCSQPPNEVERAAEVRGKLTPLLRSHGPAAVAAELERLKASGIRFGFARELAVELEACLPSRSSGEQRGPDIAKRRVRVNSDGTVSNFVTGAGFGAPYECDLEALDAEVVYDLRGAAS